MDCAPFGIIDTLLLEDLSDDGYSRVDWVGNHKYESLGSILRDSGSEITDDTSVDLPQSHEGPVKYTKHRGMAITPP